MFSRFLRWGFNLLCALFSHREVKGLENLPSGGPYIMVFNHLSFFDAPFGYGLLGSQKVTGWAAEKYERHPIFGPLLHMAGGIFIQRGQVDRPAIAAAVQWLRHGGIFAMAPEGTRSKKGSLARGKTGAAFLANEADAPIVPIGLTGTEKAPQAWRRLRRPLLTMHIGKPFTLPPLNPANRSSDLRQNTDEIMCRIAALVPPEYRGAYADHPRLHELLQSTPSWTRSIV
ncbi:MAG: 1-acyl-sn-glycerol-3-phosphate acyltransferase [Anaerolineales bacterium]|nr:1-acyl-sn-glycerol-3-phosphate acyltransferase [Anaerolineales bacterium]